MLTVLLMHVCLKQQAQAFELGCPQALLNMLGGRPNAVCAAMVALAVLTATKYGMPDPTFAQRLMEHALYMLREPGCGAACQLAACQCVVHVCCIHSQAQTALQVDAVIYPSRPCAFTRSAKELQVEYSILGVMLGSETALASLWSMFPWP